MVVKIDVKFVRYVLRSINRFGKSSVMGVKSARGNAFGWQGYNA